MEFKLNIEESFWRTYPELLLIEEFKKFKKDKGDKDSSKILWAIALCEYPNSKLYNRPSKYIEITKTYLKGIKLDWAKLDYMVELLKDTLLTDAQRALTDWNSIMKLRKASLKELYTEAVENKDVDELVKIDKMLSTTPKMFDDYKKVKQDFEAELVKNSSKPSSMSDSDEL